MSKVKIIFFDIDGTLIDMKAKRISEKTLETLKRLQQNGIRICIATGRPLIMLPEFEGLEFDTYLTFNGSYCCDTDGVIFSNPIPKADVLKVIANASAMGKPVNIASADGMMANGSEEKLVEYFAHGSQELTVSDEFENELKKDIYQLMISGTKEEYAALLEDAPGAKITAWWDQAVDVIPSNGGKGVAVEKILEHYGFLKEESMAFGDGNNDIEMLMAVGTGVAMANASAELKAVADVICGHVAEDGIYRYCLENKLI